MRQGYRASSCQVGSGGNDCLLSIKSGNQTSHIANHRLLCPRSNASLPRCNSQWDMKIFFPALYKMCFCFPLVSPLSSRAFDRSRYCRLQSLRQCQLENLQILGLAGISNADSLNIGTQSVRQFAFVAIGECSK